jgi:pyruvate,orthophosphate dikinase
MMGDVPTVEPDLSGDFGILMEWADKHRRLKVRTNAETPEDCRVARQFGAEGIGLCRTEHMFFEPSRITAVRRMILAEDTAGREAALAELLPEQRADFAEIFRVMAGLPVTIRLLDPPLHEFLPHDDEGFADVAAATGLPETLVRRRINELHEFNPMLGHRGCRLGITYPEIYDMQARAIFDAALQVRAEGGNPLPEIMIPLVATARELKQIRERIEGIIRTEYAAEAEWLQSFPIGTMIELPRACATAGEIAAVADFFSFGTNDLTQTVFGFSRDDVSTFLPSYLQAGILDADPFVTLDREGVGALIRMAVEAARATRPDIKIGLCGEHGGDPRSISFVQQGLVHYVSCSPFRVPVARLAAAQASLRNAAAAANT